ncbi:MAG: hypothetical protein AAF282_16620 [Cyanobacteria bacterium P01_A01_bin.15]
MRLPPSVRYLPSRLQALSNPWLWLGLMVTGIIGVYALEYRRNPGQLPWQAGSAAPSRTAEATPTDVLLESLTPEERAVASELDNIELLLAQLDANVSVLTTGGESSAAAALNASPSGIGTAGSPEIDEFVGESSVARLNRYIDEYRFLGTSASGANVQPAAEPQPSAQAAQPQSERAEQAQMVHALADALARQQAEQTPSPEATSEANPESEQFSTENGSSAPTGTVETPVFGQTGVVPGSLDGLNQSFIRTTPNMSPPPGTTGYVAPTSLSDFNRINQPADTNPFGTQPSSGSFGSPSPAGVPTPDRTQVLPPAQDSVVTPLADPRFDGSQQATPNQPRNAWDSFFD